MSRGDIGMSRRQRSQPVTHLPWTQASGILLKVFDLNLFVGDGQQGRVTAMGGRWSSSRSGD